MKLFATLYTLLSIPWIVFARPQLLPTVSPSSSSPTTCSDGSGNVYTSGTIFSHGSRSFQLTCGSELLYTEISSSTKPSLSDCVEDCTANAICYTVTYDKSLQKCSLRSSQGLLGTLNGVATPLVGGLTQLNSIIALVPMNSASSWSSFSLPFASSGNLNSSISTAVSTLVQTSSTRSSGLTSRSVIVTQQLLSNGTTFMTPGVTPIIAIATQQLLSPGTTTTIGLSSISSMEPQFTTASESSTSSESTLPSRGLALYVISSNQVAGPSMTSMMDNPLSVTAATSRITASAIVPSIPLTKVDPGDLSHLLDYMCAELGVCFSPPTTTSALSSAQTAPAAQTVTTTSALDQKLNPISPFGLSISAATTSESASPSSGMADALPLLKSNLSPELGFSSGRISTNSKLPLSLDPTPTIKVQMPSTFEQFIPSPFSSSSRLPSQTETTSLPGSGDTQATPNYSIANVLSQTTVMIDYTKPSIEGGFSSLSEISISSALASQYSETVTVLGSTQESATSIRPDVSDSISGHSGVYSYTSTFSTVLTTASSTQPDESSPSPLILEPPKVHNIALPTSGTEATPDQLGISSVITESARTTPALMTSLPIVSDKPLGVLLSIPNISSTATAVVTSAPSILSGDSLSPAILGLADIGLESGRVPSSETSPSRSYLMKTAGIPSATWTLLGSTEDLSPTTLPAVLTVESLQGGLHLTTTSLPLNEDLSASGMGLGLYESSSIFNLPTTDISIAISSIEVQPSFVPVTVVVDSSSVPSTVDIPSATSANVLVTKSFLDTPVSVSRQATASIASPAKILDLSPTPNSMAQVVTRLTTSSMDITIESSVTQRTTKLGPAPMDGIETNLISVATSITPLLDWSTALPEVIQSDVDDSKSTSEISSTTSSFLGEGLMKFVSLSAANLGVSPVLVTELSITNPALTQELETLTTTAIGPPISAPSPGLIAAFPLSSIHHPASATIIKGITMPGAPTMTPSIISSATRPTTTRFVAVSATPSILAYPSPASAQIDNEPILDNPTTTQRIEVITGAIAFDSHVSSRNSLSATRTEDSGVLMSLLATPQPSLLTPTIRVKTATGIVVGSSSNDSDDSEILPVENYLLRSSLTSGPTLVLGSTLRTEIVPRLSITSSKTSTSGINEVETSTSLLSSISTPGTSPSSALVATTSIPELNNLFGPLAQSDIPHTATSVLKPTAFSFPSTPTVVQVTADCCRSGTGKSLFKAIAASTRDFEILCDVALYGPGYDDLQPIATSVSLTSCIEMCSSRTTCTDVSWDASDGGCMLKGGFEYVTHSPGSCVAMEITSSGSLSTLQPMPSLALAEGYATLPRAGTSSQGHNITTRPTPLRSTMAMSADLPQSNGRHLPSVRFNIEAFLLSTPTARSFLSVISRPNSYTEQTSKDAAHPSFSDHIEPISEAAPGGSATRTAAQLFVTPAMTRQQATMLRSTTSLLSPSRFSSAALPSRPQQSSNLVEIPESSSFKGTMPTTMFSKAPIRDSMISRSASESDLLRPSSVTLPSRASQIPSVSLQEAMSEIQSTTLISLPALDYTSGQDWSSTFPHHGDPGDGVILSSSDEGESDSEYGSWSAGDSEDAYYGKDPNHSIEGAYEWITWLRWFRGHPGIAY